jgi:16S rRNA (adenine1518-N6/adenine1519-N6)-dimethyltransferase
MSISSRLRQPTFAIALSSAIRAAGITPRKSLGQNFLTDANTARRIVDAAAITSDDLVFEIGPGLGALTRHLADAAAHVIAIELDQSLIPPLQSVLAGRANVTVVHGDALEVDFVALTQAAASRRGHPFAAIRFVANLPYYITSAAIRRILECGLVVQVIVLTIQLEVAQRVVARPPEMSLLAVSVQFYGAAEILFRIPGGQFYPPPDVESAVLRITPRPQPLDVDRAIFFSWVRAGFSQKRKQLRNTLAVGLGITKAEAEAVLLKSGVDPSRRAESLGMDEWITIARSVMSWPENDHSTAPQAR